MEWKFDTHCIRIPLDISEIASLSFSVNFFCFASPCVFIHLQTSATCLSLSLSLVSLFSTQQLLLSTNGLSQLTTPCLSFSFLSLLSSLFSLLSSLYSIPSDTYSQNPGASMCQECPTGSTAPSMGATQCQPIHSDDRSHGP
jgi:hypothetical protein